MQVAIPQQKLNALCQQWSIQKLEVFGSALRDDFRPDSDLDLLVTFDQAAQRSAFEHLEVQEALEELFERPVDLVSKRAVEESRNWIRRKAILEHTESIYGS